MSKCTQEPQTIYTQALVERLGGLPVVKWLKGIVDILLPRPADPRIQALAFKHLFRSHSTPLYGTASIFWKFLSLASF